MLIIPPHNPDEQSPVQEYLVSLGGTELTLTYQYQLRQNAWYLSVTDSVGTVLLNAHKLTHGWPILGRIMCLDTLAETSPGYEDLGRRHLMLFFEDTDLTPAVDEYTVSIEVE